MHLEASSDEDSWLFIFILGLRVPRRNVLEENGGKKTRLRGGGTLRRLCALPSSAGAHLPAAVKGGTECPGKEAWLYHKCAGVIIYEFHR